MPQPLHDAWGGYLRLMPYGPDKKPLKGAKAKAQCKKCGKTMHNIKRNTLAKHTEICQGIQVEDVSSDGSATPESSSSNPELSNNPANVLERSNSSSTSPARTLQKTSLPPTSKDTTRPSTLNKSKLTNDRVMKTKEDSNTSSTSGLSELDEEEVLLLAQARKRGQKRRTKSESQMYQTTDDDKAIALYKYYIVSNMEFNNIQLPATKELFKALDPTLALPTVEDLRTTVADKAAEKVFQTNHSKHHTQVMQLLTRIISGKIDDGTGNLKDCNKILALTLLRSEKGDWTYIKNVQFLADPTADSSSNIQQFCDESVLEAKVTYDVQVLFVIHNGDYILKQVSSVVTETEEWQYFTICDMLSLLKNLCCDLISNADNNDKVTSYYNTMKNHISADILATNPSMAVTMQRVFEAVSLLDRVNQSIVSKKLAEIVNPLHLATKVFQPQFHLSYLDEEVHKTLYEMFYDFQQHTAPALLADPVFYYLGKTGSCFTRFYRENRDEDPVNFWKGSKLDPYLGNVKLLANYALQLLALPSTLISIDLKQAFLKLDKYAVRTTDFENVVFSYLLE